MASATAKGPATTAVPPDLLFAQKASAVVKASGMNPKSLDLEKFRELSPVIFTKAYEAIYNEVISTNSCTRDDFISDTQAVIDNLYVKTKNSALKTVTGADLCDGVHRAIGILVAVLFAEGQRLWLEKNNGNKGPAENNDAKSAKGKTSRTVTSRTSTAGATPSAVKHEHRPHSPLRQRVEAAKDTYIGEREKKQIASRLAARIRSLREKAAAEEAALEAAAVSSKDNDVSSGTGVSRTKGRVRRKKRKSNKKSKGREISDSDGILDSDDNFMMNSNGADADNTNNNDDDTGYVEDKDHNDNDDSREGRAKPKRPSSAPAARKTKPAMPAVSRRLYDPRTFTEKMRFLQAIDDSILNTTNDLANKENIQNELKKRNEQRDANKDVNFTYDLKSGRKIFLTLDEVERIRLRKIEAADAEDVDKGNDFTAHGSPAVKVPTKPMWPGTSTEQSYKDWLRKMQSAKSRSDGKPDNIAAPRARFFNAYPRLRNRDLVVSIEHCHHCQHHNTTLRHDAAEYTKQADSMLKCLSKVVHESGAAVRLGVIRFRAKVTPGSKASDEDSRIGAFEIQVAYRDHTGYITPELLHSKLATRKWPSASVVEKRLRIWLGSLPVPSIDHTDEEAGSYSDSAVEGLGSSYPVGAGQWSETALAEAGWVYPAYTPSSPANTSFDMSNDDASSSPSSRKKITNVVWVYDSSEEPSSVPPETIKPPPPQQPTTGATAIVPVGSSSIQKSSRKDSTHLQSDTINNISSKDVPDVPAAPTVSKPLMKQEISFTAQSSNGAVELKRDLAPIDHYEEDDYHAYDNDDFVDDFFENIHKVGAEVEVVLPDEQRIADKSSATVATVPPLLMSTSPRPTSRPGTGRGAAVGSAAIGSARGSSSNNSKDVSKGVVDEKMAFSPLQKDKKELSFSNTDKIISSNTAGDDEGGYDDEFETAGDDDDDAAERSHPDGLNHSGGSERVLSTHEVDSMQNYYASLLTGGDDNDDGADDFDF